MKINYEMQRFNDDGSVYKCVGVTSQFGIFILLTHFIDDHGTGINDFDSFTCKIIDEGDDKK